MAQYELMFEVDGLDDQLTEEIYAHYDALVAAHSDSTTLTITAEGSTAAVAAKQIIIELEEKLGVNVRRLVEDLVTRADIASRSGATPQAVGLWIRGTRHRGCPFPARFNRVGGGVWLWGEVNDWLRRVGRPNDEEVMYPSRKDYDEVNAWISENEAKRKFATVRARVHYGSSPANRPLTGSDFATPPVAGTRVLIFNGR